VEFDYIRGNTRRPGFSTNLRSDGRILRAIETNLDAYRLLGVLEFDLAASQIDRGLKSSRLSVGTMDPRIAAIVISRDATLLSRNLGDFRKVPALKVEDWSL
jgi:tRNA(fMet)-specific endonuclease VapC